MVVQGVARMYVASNHTDQAASQELQILDRRYEARQGWIAAHVNDGCPIDLPNIS